MDGMIRVLYLSQHLEDEVLHRNLSVILWSCAGVSKAQSSVDYAMLEYCIREDLKTEEVHV